MERKPLTAQEIREAQELCIVMGECTATYYLALALGEINRLKDALVIEENHLRQMKDARDDLKRWIAQLTGATA